MNDMKRQFRERTKREKKEIVQWLEIPPRGIARPGAHGERRQPCRKKKEVIK